MKKLLLATLAALATGSVFAQSVFVDNEICGGCRMIVKNYPGPKGVIVFEDGSDKTYCSSKCFACNVLRMKAEPNGMKNVKAVLVQDTAKIVWEQPHSGADELVDASKAWYVYGSSKRATMGRSLAPFADKAQAEAFVKEFGGALYTFDELTPELINCRKKAKAH